MVSLIKLQVPRTFISRKETKSNEGKSYVFTYEYGWSKLPTIIPQCILEINGDSINLLPDSFSATISFLSKSVRRVSDGCT